MHNTSPNNSVSAQQAISNGLDVIFQTAYEHHRLFDPPFLNGSIDQERIDDAVSRVLRAKFELGLFENPYVSEENILSNTNMKAHKELAKKAALESIVLLKNASLPGQKNKILPLNKNIKSIAVIGEDAVEARLGGYSGPGNNKVNILDGIKQSAGKSTTILYAEGAGIKNEEWVVIPSKYLFHNENRKKEKGLKVEYYSNILLKDSLLL